MNRRRLLRFGVCPWLRVPTQTGPTARAWVAHRIDSRCLVVRLTLKDGEREALIDTALKVLAQRHGPLHLLGYADADRLLARDPAILLLDEWLGITAAQGLELIH